MGPPGTHAEELNVVVVAAAPLIGHAYNLQLNDDGNYS